MYAQVKQNESETLLRSPTSRRRLAWIVICLVLLFVSVMALSHSTKQNNYNQQDDSPSSQSNTESIAPMDPKYSDFAVGDKCKRNWSPEFTRKYEHECGFWLKKLDKWQTVEEPESSIAYMCDNERQCHGWGDRVAGILSAFFKSIQTHSKFKIVHEGLAEFFQPCLLTAPWTNWVEEKEVIHMDYKTCIFRDSPRCHDWIRMTCSSGPLVTKNTDRTCIPPAFCDSLIKENPSASAVNVVGCALRAIFEPSDLMFRETKFPFKIGIEKPREMTLEEIQKELAKYYVISIQYRMGDGMAFYHHDKQISPDREPFVRPFRCAETLESYKTNDGKLTHVNGKEIRWFFATDDLQEKHMASKLYANKLFTLDIRPEHVAITNIRSQALLNTIVEWYILGLGDELIVNKVGGSKEVRDAFHGRLSGFPKTSWAYHLKHMVYDAGRCAQYSVPFDGTWGEIFKVGCGKSQLYRGRTKYPNEHLARLAELNLTFPEAWVSSRGEILKLSQEEAEELKKEEEEGEEEEENMNEMDP